MAVGRRPDAALAVAPHRRRARRRPSSTSAAARGTAARRAAASARTVTGVDPAAVMLRVAPPVPRPRARPLRRRARAEALPLADDSATVVWSIATVHHWPDIDAGLAEARRVLRPGGRFLAIERRARRRRHGLASHGWTDEQAEAFADACRAAGFVDV